MQNKRYSILYGLLVLTMFFSYTSVSAKQPASIAKGRLFIIGGGERTSQLMERFVALAGGAGAKILVIPFASEYTEEVGTSQSEEFRNLGCQADYILFEKGQADLEENLAKLDSITGVFFSGGDQLRLTGMLLGTKFLERIKEIYRQGGVVGGTSAGAAIMSKIMITGEEAINKDNDVAFPMIKKDNVVTAEGFGFIDFAIIDQHFIKRKRENRLIELVITHQMPGIGIDESTAIIVDGTGSFEVLGDGSVMVFEPHFSTPSRIDERGNLSADWISLRILLSGDHYTLNKKKYNT